ncbi:MAG: tryptophan-rich sensory protein [Gammaproteobacteria bacterium]|nr:tryptophan-rich sensory protein [Gammaproteobacteria bacterium]MCY4358379.1 tryptophan-rich sensory protein [Gammaproteobacteria bacterium]
MSGIKPVLFAAVAVLLVASLGATITDLGQWYQQLAKPAWQPPDWLFGPAWTLIFGLTAISAVQVWKDAVADQRAWIIGLFCLNGFLNILWSLLFFRAQRPDWAQLEVILLWLSILGLMVVTARYSKLSTVLLLPYLLWVTFAGYLNYTVVKLNGPF